MAIVHKQVGRLTISRVITDGLGRVALATRLVPSDSAGRRSFGSDIEKPAKELRAVTLEHSVSNSL